MYCANDEFVGDMTLEEFKANEKTFSKKAKSNSKNTKSR